MYQEYVPHFSLGVVGRKPSLDIGIHRDPSTTLPQEGFGHLWRVTSDRDLQAFCEQALEGMGEAASVVSSSQTNHTVRLVGSGGDTVLVAMVEKSHL